jgi:TolA-binding protein
MRKLAAVILFMLLGALTRVPAQASGDFGCYPEWTLSHPDFTGCDNMAMLQPGNDTRANLLLLLLDKRGDGPIFPATKPTPDPLVDWPIFGLQFQPPQPPAIDGSTPIDESSSTDYAEGEGSRCRSDAAGDSAFEKAVGAATDIPESERAALIDARHHLSPTCTGPSGGAAAVAQLARTVQSPAGKNFLVYLQAAQAFYEGDFDPAAKGFGALAAVNQPWLSETARYMLGRVEMNRQQIGLFDDYGAMPPGKVADPKVTDAAEAAFNAYLQAYPQGLYAVSARGLLRRVYWLGGRTDKLAETYATALTDRPGARGLGDTAYADEVDAKLLGFTENSSGPKDTWEPTFAKDPTLLAVFDLQRMRCGSENYQDTVCRTPFERSWLEGQDLSFAASPDLFEYLLALYDYYYDGSSNGTVAALKIPEMIPQAPFTTLEFSRQMLRGMALEATKDPKALDHWMAMLPMTQRPMQRGAVELAIAYHDERNHAVDQVFAADSPVSNPVLRQVLLENIADAPLLRKQASDPTVSKSERNIALYTLLYKELSRGHPADFLKDVPLVTDDVIVEGYPAPGWDKPHWPVEVFAQATAGEYDCKPLKDIATLLARNPKDSKAQLCLADFFLANGFDYETLDTPPTDDVLGSTPTLFKGPVYSRQAVYQRLIASAKTPADDKAYALYRAVMCYSPSGNNSCGGKDVAPSQRKAWFMQLKKNYPSSPWAKALQYYW